MKSTKLFSRSFSVLLIIAACTLSTSIYASGFIVPSPRTGEEIPPLTVKSIHVNAEIIDQVAKTTIDEVFLNHHPREIEGTFIFPLPDDVAISEFVMYSGDTKLEGEVLDSDRARNIYVDIVRRMRDPALLEYAGRKMFKARVYPIPANGEKRITLSYTQILNADGDLVNYTYPLNAGRLSKDPLEQVILSAKIHSKVPISNIYSPTHKVSVKQESEEEAKVSFEVSKLKPDRDFQLYYSVTREEVGLSFLTYEGEDWNYFMLLASPPYVNKKEKTLNKDLIFVLDSSGSMEGGKIKQAKEALRFIINHLDERDRFGLIDFDDGVKLFSDRMIPATKVNREDALRFVDEIEDSGGTNINEALLEALKMAEGEGRPTYILFLTDGCPTVGTTDTAQILKNFEKANRHGSRVFVFGVGYDVNAKLLNRTADENRGITIYVDENEDIERALSNYYEKISSPLLSDLSVEFENIEVIERYPRILPDLFKGSQLVLVGKYKGEGPVEVKLSGKVGREEKRFVLRDRNLGNDGSYSFLPRLWAMRRVGYLLAEMWLHGEQQELIDDVKKLGVKFGVVTPYTSFLITEKGAGPGQRNVTVQGSRERDFKAIVDGVRNVDPLTGQFMSDVNPDAIEEIVVITGGAGAEFSRAQAANQPIVSTAGTVIHVVASDQAVNQAPDQETAVTFSDSFINDLPVAGREYHSIIARSVAIQGGTESTIEGSVPGGVLGGVLGGALTDNKSNVLAAKAIEETEISDQAPLPDSLKVRYKDGKTFHLKEGCWVDSEYKEGKPAKEIIFNSEEYYCLISEKPGIVKYLSIDKKILVCFEGMNYKIIEERKEEGNNRQ